MYRLLSAATTVAIVVASLVLTSDTAYGHERRDVGSYQLDVGWENEPAYVGQLNYLHLEVVDSRTKQPVAGLEKTLAAEVAAGGLASLKLEIAPAADAGVYNGPVIPTVTGTYTFHITGKIGTQTIDEKFTSGPNTFVDITDVGGLQYPTKVPVAADLARKLDAISSAVDQTRIIALGALVVALAGIGAGVFFRRRP